MIIREVNSAKLVRAFLDLPKKIYHSIPQYIFPLEKDVEAVFDPKKNKFFRHGKCIRWVLESDQGEIIGRVAAFVNEKHAQQFKRPVGGMGFFEVIENKEAAFLLLDTCKNWLAEQGMDSMDGPINFGERDKFWGLITENFERRSYYGQTYNPEYYKAYLEEYGFDVFFKQLIFTRKVDEPLQEKYVERAAKIAQDPDFVVENMRIKEMAKYTEDFRTIYNKAWGKREGDTFKGMSKAQSKNIMKAMKPILDERICCFVYHQGEPIAFFIALPEMNEFFRHVNGKFGLLQKLNIGLRLKLQKRKVAIGLAFGVSPEFQGKGVEGAMFNFLSNNLIGKGIYEEFIITWIGDFNGKMVNIIKSLGCKQEQTMATYRYLFDRTEVFERHPFV